jgi:molecular chaperone GrpE
VSDASEVDTDRRSDTFSTGTEEGEGDAPLFDAGEVDEMAGYSSCEEALEDAVASLEKVTTERDDYLDLARRVQAEFENYRKRVDAQRSDQIARAAESLIVELLPVLDGCEAAVAHGSVDVEPIHNSLVGLLARQGLEKVDEVGVPFDPNQHEAVLSEPADDDEKDEGPVVAEVMRSGYQWNGRVVRPAMVKVRG